PRLVRPRRAFPLRRHCRFNPRLPPGRTTCPPPPPPQIAVRTSSLRVLCDSVAILPASLETLFLPSFSLQTAAATLRSCSISLNASANGNPSPSPPASPGSS